MKKNLCNFLFVALLSLTIAACNHKQEVWNIKATYTDGTIKEERLPVTKDSFISITYYKSGDTDIISHYKDDLLSGSYTRYNKNRTLHVRATYREGSRVDTFFAYGSDGILDQVQIIDGACPDTLCCCDGIHLNFKNGKLEERFRMKDLAGDGLHETFYPSGKLHEKYYMKNCALEGNLKSWYENGHVKADGTYLGDEKDGAWKFWSANGDYYAENYKNGKFEGPYFEHVTDSSSKVLITEGQYINGKAIGHWLTFDKDSILYFECDYVDGERTGLYTQYYKNNKIEKQGKLIKDEWEGAVKVYKEDGQLESITTYHLGKKIKKEIIH